MSWKAIDSDVLENMPMPDINSPVSDDWAQSLASHYIPIQPGTYTLRITEVEPIESRSGWLSVQAMFQVEGGESDGSTFTQRFSSKPYYQPPEGVRMRAEERASQPRNTSQLYELLRVCGSQRRFTEFCQMKPSEMWRVAEGLESRDIEGVNVGWNGYCKQCRKETFKKATQFPRRNGKRVEEVPCPDCREPVYAREVIPFGGFPKVTP